MADLDPAGIRDTCRMRTGGGKVQTTGERRHTVNDMQSCDRRREEERRRQRRAEEERGCVRCVRGVLPEAVAYSNVTKGWFRAHLNQSVSITSPTQHMTQITSGFL